MTPPSSHQGGFSLIEVLAAGVIAILAVTGLAYSFGTGRGLINEYEVARAALGIAQQRLEILSTLPVSAPEFADSVHVRPFQHAGAEAGTEVWTVSWYNDPATPIANDLRRVTVTVKWPANVPVDSVSLSRLFLPS